MYIFYSSSRPDGYPGSVTSVSVSEPAMRLPPVYVGSQTKYRGKYLFFRVACFDVMSNKVIRPKNATAPPTEQYAIAWLIMVATLEEWVIEE